MSVGGKVCQFEKKTYALAQAHLSIKNLKSNTQLTSQCKTKKLLWERNLQKKKEQKRQKKKKESMHCCSKLDIDACRDLSALAAITS